MANWIRIGLLSDIPRRGARCVQSPWGRIAVFRTAEDRVFAMEDRCPHKAGPLSQGIVFGDRVACPLHNWTIGLADGAALAPDNGSTPRFAVKVEDGRVYLDLDELNSVATEPAAACAGSCEHA